MHSAIYSGWLRHRRFAPREHAFRYRLFLVYLDLAEIDSRFQGPLAVGHGTLGARALSSRGPLRRSGRPARPGGAHARRRTHWHPPRRSHSSAYAPALFRLLLQSGVLLLLLRRRRHAASRPIVAEVTSTPWGERHCYVLHERAGAERPGGFMRYRSQKALHVSPFMPMATRLSLELSACPVPRPQRAHGAARQLTKVFDATMCI